MVWPYVGVGVGVVGIIFLVIMKKASAKLDARLDHLKTRLSEARKRKKSFSDWKARQDELVGRLSNYPKEMDFLLESLEALKGQMRESEVKMNEAGSRGNDREAYFYKLRGLVAIEHFEAWMASAKRKQAEWDIDSKLLDKMEQELKEL